MERRSFVLALKPGMKGEYVRRHDDLWPEMAEMLHDAGVRNYSIWWYRDRLFGYYECENLAASDAFKANSPVQRRWSEYMSDLISYEEVDGAPVPAPELVFYLP